MRFFPFVSLKELIYKAPANYLYHTVPNNLKVIDLNLKNIDEIKMPSDIYNYCFFRLKRSFSGIGLVNIDNEELIGYGFYSNTMIPPTNIPKLPKNSGWLFNTQIIEKYRGNGYQKLLISERIKRLKAKDKYINIYTDILEDNISSRKSVINSGFEEAGVYYIMVLGLRRFKYLNLKIGYWNKTIKHKQL